MRLAHAVALLALAGCGEDGASRIAHYIKKSPYPKLVLEVDFVPGFQPRESARTGLATGLSSVIDKPGGITAQLDKALASKGEGHAWTFDELDALARSTFDLGAGGDTVKMHVLYLDGHSADDTAEGKVLGLAWSNTHLAMFKKTLDDLCSGAVLPAIKERLCSAAELSVWTHETGHLLGLVDNGLKMVRDHKDPDAAHGRHDRSDQCVMYWAYEGKGIIDLLRTRVMGGNDAALGFDGECLADINAVKSAP